jgi:hypothetical protein
MSTTRRRVAVVAVSLAASASTACGGNEAGTTPSASSLPGPTTTASDASSTTATATATAITTAITTTTATSGPSLRVIEVRLVGGDVEGGPRLETVAVGDTVTIRAVSDVAEELHVHTYDLTADLRPATPGEVTFDASIPGRHEVEFERSGQLAITLKVG